MLRRSHKKSRRGCLECKRRHIKVCDFLIDLRVLYGGSRGEAIPQLDSRRRLGSPLTSMSATIRYSQRRMETANLRLTFPPKTVR